MPDEARVVLSAVDNVTLPVDKAVDSLKRFQGATMSVSSSVNTVAYGVPKYASELDDLGKTTDRATLSHQSAYKALGLVSSSLVDLTGGSAAAEAGVRALDGVLFKMATTGATASMGFIGFVAAAAAVGYALKTSTENTRKQREEMSQLNDTVIASVKNLDYLDRAQKSVAGVGAAQLNERVLKLKTDIADLNEKMRESAARSAAMNASQKVDLGGMEGSVTLPGRESGNSADYVKMAGNLRVLQEALKQAQQEQGEMTNKSAAYRSVVSDMGNPLLSYAAGLERNAATMERIGQIAGNLQFDYAALSNSANNAGISVTDAAQIMVAQNNIVESSVKNLAMTFGQTIGNAVSKGKDAWREGLKMMVGAVFDAATQVVLAAAIMNQALTFALIPGTFIGILALVAVLQGMKAVVMNAMSSAASNVSQEGASQFAASNTASSKAGGASNGSGAGGSSISSASKEVVNNIAVHLPVQVLDLASISDIQLKSLAVRVGRVLADAAGQGQFSLVGA